MHLHFRGRYTLLGRLSHKPDKDVKVAVPADVGDGVNVRIRKGGKSAETRFRAEVHEPVFQALNAGLDFGKLSQDQQDGINAVKTQLRNCTRQVLSLVKYCLYHPGLSESLFSVRDEMWAEKWHGEWRRLPLVLTAEFVGSKPFVALNQRTALTLEKYAATGYLALSALTYLHWAETETAPRSRWRPPPNWRSKSF